MKSTLKNLAIVSILINFVILFAFVVPIKPDTRATVRKVEGLYIFHYCDPEGEYEKVGEGNPFMYNPTPDQAIDGCITRAKKKTPNANAIIISDDMLSYEAIILKEKE